MIEQMLDFASQKTLLDGYANWFVIIGSIVLVTFFLFVARWYILNRKAIHFGIMNALYNWPLIGRMSKHKKDIKIDKGWSAGELKLCEDYYYEYHKYASINDDYYNKCRDYLSKADEVSRKPIPIWVWLILVMLVFFEASIFGKLLLEFVGEFSANDVKLYSYLVAFLMAIILVWLTDRTGAELYKNSKIKKVRFWQKTEMEGSNIIPIPNLHASLQTTYEDGKDMRYQQLLNRIDNINAEVKPSFLFTGITIVFIAIIATIAFLQRATLNEEMITDMPYAAIATYVFFSVIFIFIQFLGIFIGYTYSFVSKEGKMAWLKSHKYRTAEEFCRPFDLRVQYIKNQAQINLGKLQKYFNMHHKDLEITPNNAFDAFIAKKTNHLIKNIG